MTSAAPRSPSVIAGELFEILHHIAPDVDSTTVDRSRPLADQLDLDSMDYQSFLAAIAARYAIEIPERDVARLRSIDDVVHYIDAALRA